jgi:hypothetical protein
LSVCVASIFCSWQVLVEAVKACVTLASHNGTDVQVQEVTGRTVRTTVEEALGVPPGTIKADPALNQAVKAATNAVCNLEGQSVPDWAVATMVRLLGARRLWYDSTLLLHNRLRAGPMAVAIKGQPLVRKYAASCSRQTLHSDRGWAVRAGGSASPAASRRNGDLRGGTRPRRRPGSHRSVPLLRTSGFRGPAVHRCAASRMEHLARMGTTAHVRSVEINLVLLLLGPLLLSSACFERRRVHRYGR